jgi:hypothetical protein
MKRWQTCDQAGRGGNVWFIHRQSTKNGELPW